MYALTLVIATLFVFFTLFSSYSSIDTISASFLDYRNALYQSYLSHDVEYSLRTLFSFLRGRCTALYAAGEADKCPALANMLFTSFLSSWASQGVSMSGGGISVTISDDGVDIRLVSDLHWEKGPYSGVIPAGYGG